MKCFHSYLYLKKKNQTSRSVHKVFLRLRKSSQHALIAITFGFSLCLVVIISSLIQFPFPVIEGRSLLLLYNADKSAACRPRKCNLSRVGLALTHLMVANDDVEGQRRCSSLRSLCLPLPTPDAEFINRLQLALSVAVPVELLKENYGPLRSREGLY